MDTTAYLTSYNALICEDCIDGRTNVTPVSASDLRDVFGYERACCEECKTTLYDGLLAVA